MVIVPADQLARLSVRLVGNAVVDDQDRVLVLHPADERFDDLPEIGRGQGLWREEAHDRVIADVRLQQPRQARGGRRAERGDQIIRIQSQEWLVEGRLVHHAYGTSLPDENGMANIQQDA